MLTSPDPEKESLSSEIDELWNTLWKNWTIPTWTDEESNCSKKSPTADDQDRTREIDPGPDLGNKHFLFYYPTETP